MKVVYFCCVFLRFSLISLLLINQLFLPLILGFSAHLFYRCNNFLLINEIVLILALLV